MRKKDLNRKQKNILIGSLLAVLVVMAVAYAAFSSSLNINGTASVSSTWNIQITGVTPTASGSATSQSATYSGTSATISANLVLPGDYVDYAITVSNNGSVDAKLDTLSGITSNNDAIEITKVSGLSAGDSISAGSSKTLTVRIKYKSTVTSQPSSTTASTTISMTFSQYIEPDITYVYAFNINSVYYAGSSQSASSAIGTTYSTLLALATAESSNFGIKYGIEDNMVTEAYVCGLYNGTTEFCLQGSTDGSTYESNKTILTNIFGSSSCTDDSSNFNCSGGSLAALAYSSGKVNVNVGGWGCRVYDSGNAYCDSN